MLLRLSPDTSPAEAADRAVALCREFVCIAKRQVPDEPSADADRPLVPKWRHVLTLNASPHEDLLLREHYENTRTLSDVSQSTGVSEADLQSARTKLREVLRTALITDRVTAQEWGPERLDALTERLVTMARGTCPSMRRVLSGSEREHVRRCSVCGRARRLVNAGTLTAEDLILESPVPWPRTEGDVLAIHLHPDARHNRDRLVSELSVPAFPVGDDQLFVDLDDPDDVHRILILAAEAGLPSREHIRAVSVRGPLRWSSHGLLGPLIRLGAARLKGAPWGLVGGLGELPEPLPPPPSARPVWGVAAVLAVITILVATQRIGPASASTDALSSTFTQARGGVWTEFRAADTSLLTIVREVDRELDVVLASQHAADKAALAVGDGTYRAHLMGDGVLLVASSEPLSDLPTLVAASAGAEPLSDLEQRIRARWPDASIRRTERELP